MSKLMEHQSDHDSKMYFFTEVSSPEISKPKVAEMTKGKSRLRGRKTLADISNIPEGFTASNQNHKAGTSSDALRKHNEQLQKENATLKKHLADKNKVIELAGTEMQKLMVTLEKIKQQNLQLAQSNSQMLAELNSAKEKQKALSHELGCKNGLIIAKNLELEEKDKSRMGQASDSDLNKVAEPEEAEVCTVAEGDDDKHYTNSKTQISNSTVQSNKKIQDNDKGKSKRLQTRRQSANFKLDEFKPTQDSLKIDGVDDDNQVKVNDSNSGTSSLSSSSSSSSNLKDKGDSFQNYNKLQEHRKLSYSRPVREAAKKVQSYKEVSVIAKMRRD